LLPLNFIFLAHLLLLPVARHLAMKLPAHLPECLFTLQLSTFLVEILDLDTVSILIVSVTELSKLLFNSLFFVSTYGCCLTEHPSVSEYL
jgi:hypothetical protein